MVRTAPHGVPSHGVPFQEAVRVWTRVALLSFGGPAGQIAVMHRILVAEKRWIGDRRFLHALNCCMLLPGPEAHQLAVYLGWLMHGVRGGILAGTLFLLPGAVVMLGLSFLYVALGEVAPVAGLFFGLKAAVLAIVLQAVVRVGSRTLRTPALRAMAAASFVAIFLFGAPFPAIVLGAGLVGYAASRAGSAAFSAGRGPAGAGTDEVSDADSALGAAIPTHASGLRLGLVAICAALWLAPVLALVLILGPDDVFARLGLFFSQMALVTFGGAYAVLAYVAQEAVQTYGWLRPGEMLDGLGLAETTPGPLILVVQFVGFLAAYRAPGGLNPWLAASLGALIVAWVTFLPSFLWIFLGAPYAERLRSDQTLSAALSAITAAVVGVILNLALWFGLHVLFRAVQPVRLGPLRFDLPDPSSLDPAALGLSVLALLAVFRLRLGIGTVLAGSSLLGLAWFAFDGRL